MDKIPILFIGGGRRVELAQKFIDRGFDIYAYETQVKSPIANIAKAVFNQHPLNKESAISDDIFSIMKENNIKLCIPLTDKMSDFCAKWKLPINCVGAPYCYNKKTLALCLSKKEYYPNPTSYPIIYKPVCGNGSKDIHIVNSWFFDKYKKNENYIGQKYIYGQEYSIDCYFDKNSYLIGYCTRSRDRVADGEVIESLVVNDNASTFRKICVDVGLSLRLTGPTCIQCIYDYATMNIYLMEVNARFGGGATLSIEAGLDMIDMIKKEYVDGQKLCHQTYDNIKVGMKMIRSYKDHYFENSN